jgi:hypothetical protein
LARDTATLNNRCHSVLVTAECVRDDHEEEDDVTLVALEVGGVPTPGAAAPSPSDPSGRAACCVTASSVRFTGG